ncbi:MAG: hypothetical protein ACK4N4_02730 [Burkholderiales bacterium]
MSRLSPERLFVSLAPGSVSWLKLSGSRPQVVARHTIPADTTYGPESWQGVVAALRSAAEAWRKDIVTVTIVLSNHFVRYALTPSDTAVSGTAEEHALARFYFTKVHGERARSWEVRLDDAARGTPRLACAIDAALLEALRACFPPRGRMKLVSVQPLLMSAFNCWRREFPPGGAWLLLLEAGRACLGLLVGRNWISVQNVKGHFPDEQAWVELLDRERWRTGLDRVPETVLVHAPSFPDALRGTGSGWKLQKLRVAMPVELSPAADSIYAAALTAI